MSVASSNGLTLNSPSDAAWRLDSVLGADRRSLAAFRIGCASLLLIDLCLRARHIGEFYTDSGICPRAICGQPILLAPLHNLSGALEYQLFLFALAFLFALMLLVGLSTRLTGCASWILLLSLQHRNLQLDNGGDTLLRLLLLWGLFVPLGACWSLDARKRSFAESPQTVSIGTVALRVQCLLVYLVAGLVKTGDTWQRDGTALQFVLGDDYWTLPFAYLVRDQPEMLRLVTLGIPPFEVFCPFLLFLPSRRGVLRLVVLAVFLVFQLGLIFSLRLQLFPWANIVALFPFIPTAFWDRFSSSEVGRLRPTVSLPPVPRLAIVAGRMAALLLLLYSAIAGLEAVGYLKVPNRITIFFGSVGLVQRWNLYAPDVERFDSEFELVGTLDDGTQIDLASTELGDPGWRPTQSFLATDRFRAYQYSVTRGPEGRPREQSFLAWLCRRWQAAVFAPGLAHIEHRFARHHLPKPGHRERFILYDTDCSTRSSTVARSRERADDVSANGELQ